MQGCALGAGQGLHWQRRGQGSRSLCRGGGELMRPLPVPHSPVFLQSTKLSWRPKLGDHSGIPLSNMGFSCGPWQYGEDRTLLTIHPVLQLNHRPVSNSTRSSLGKNDQQRVVWWAHSTGEKNHCPFVNQCHRHLFLLIFMGTERVILAEMG